MFWITFPLSIECLLALNLLNYNIKFLKKPNLINFSTLKSEFKKSVWMKS